MEEDRPIEDVQEILSGGGSSGGSKVHTQFPWRRP